MYKVQQNEAKAYENSANIWIINMGGGAQLRANRKSTKAGQKQTTQYQDLCSNWSIFSENKNVWKRDVIGDTISGNCNLDQWIWA